MLDIGKYIIDEPYRQDDHNGYDQLNGDWAIYYKVATKFCHKAKAQDREDLLHTIILNLAIAHRSNGHKPDNPSWMYRIASVTVTHYWRDYYRITNGLDCRWCSKAQRQKCKQDWLYSECPKAISLESLNKPIVGDNGQITELGDLITDDKAIDLAEWTDINTFLRGCPQRLIAIAEKIREGKALTVADRKYLFKWRKKEQERLF
jgi:DNA-directed RNA polymerase specialized sigma24 family protein